MKRKIHKFSDLDWTDFYINNGKNFEICYFFTNKTIVISTKDGWINETTQFIVM